MSLSRLPNSFSPRKAKPNQEAEDSRWKSLYTLGGSAALVGAVLAVIEVVIEMGNSSLTSSPLTVLGWFTLLQSDKVLGLALLGIFEVAFFPLCLIMFLALYPALRRISESLVVTAFIINLISTVAYLTTNTALSMASLSDQYLAATTDAQRNILLSAGQAMMATAQGTGYNVAFVLGSIAGLIVSVVMLRSKAFGKPTAVIGIVGNALGLPGAALGPVLWAVNGLLMLVWIVMVGIKLLKLTRSQPTLEATAN